MLANAMIIRTNKALGSSSWPSVANSIRTFHPPKAFPVVTSPEDVQEKVHTMIRYRKEAKDHWQMPEETIERGSGDCEDHAILKMALLRFIGIRSSLLIVQMKRNDEGHALCALEDPWRYLDCRHGEILSDDEIDEYVPLYLLGIPGNRIVLRTIDRSA